MFFLALSGGRDKRLKRGPYSTVCTGCAGSCFWPDNLEPQNLVA